VRVGRVAGLSDTLNPSAAQYTMASSHRCSIAESVKVGTQQQGTRSTKRKAVSELDVGVTESRESHLKFPPIPSIAFQNYKGGVGKSTDALAVSAALASLGLNVLIIDTDSQMSLTHLAVRAPLERFGKSLPEFIAACKTHAKAVCTCPLGSALLKTTCHTLVPLDALCVASYNPVAGGASSGAAGPAGGGNVYIVPGDRHMTRYEETLAMYMAHNNQGGSTGPYRDSFSAPSFLSQITANSLGVDIILWDLSPSSSLSNRNILGSCDFLIAPCLSDALSVDALDNMSHQIVEKTDSSASDKSQGVMHLHAHISKVQRFKKLGNFSEDNCKYLLPPFVLKWMGVIINRAQPTADISKVRASVRTVG
jgi:cellulose biosynthesis protein BcsQ